MEAEDNLLEPGPDNEQSDQEPQPEPHKDHEPPSTRTLELEPEPMQEPQPPSACAQDEAEAAEIEAKDYLLEPRPDNEQSDQEPQPEPHQDHNPPSARTLELEPELMQEQLLPSACAQDEADAAEMEVEYNTKESPPYA